MALINPNTIATAPVKVMINIGACMDISTGTFLKGTRGEHVLNGGLPALMGIIGEGNTFKSTLEHFVSFTALSRMNPECAGETYDTESNVHEPHLKMHYDRIPEFKGEDILDTGRWKVIDKTSGDNGTPGNVWFAQHKTFLNEKRKDKRNRLATPFRDRDMVTPLKIVTPTFSELDSFTEFSTDDVEAIKNSNELGDKKNNIINVRQGLSKYQLLGELAALNSGAYDYMVTTAHVGADGGMEQSGPPGMPQEKKLQHLAAGKKIKGTTEKFMFATLTCWWCIRARTLINQGTKTPEYPRDTDDDLQLDTDLNEVKIKTVRGKSGKSGHPIDLIVSQTDGVLPSLTEFHHIKEMGRFGLEGNNTSYALSLLPEVKLMRTTVRGKIDSDPVLRRALNITSEMCQIDYLWHHAKPIMCTPKELYDDLKAMGYDWSVLLNTRGWWTTLENEVNHPPFLSTWDLLLMRLGEYIPFWFTPEQKAAIDLSKAKKRKEA
jgi:hypothetical protein